MAKPETLEAFARIDTIYETCTNCMEMDECMEIPTTKDLDIIRGDIYLCAECIDDFEITFEEKVAN